ncbi:hypothetical protein DIURU_003509 [Diutina rugosa]|uniref:2,5-diamino-6-ribosylamino-4(3H)-pyrimidinone 5'-phosphate reductase n=1 Tax=Diutina rugosa TaxID=5481 RepID=A0A642ULF9_DIURU|nr:uncharacterized protein DIURU_003509 [Diutina rugosa]KAA8901139.1 hypothetical protein DIURU_003509 [Diutina rugosa]
MSLTPLPEDLKEFLEPYLPSAPKNSSHPFVTLTWAQSLDSKISAAPGVRTVISHAETKTMTHYLRSRHQAILIGVGTALADDPKLTCRYPDDTKPSTIFPFVVDPKGRWDYSKSTLYQLNKEKKAWAPYIITSEQVDDGGLLESMGGRRIILPLRDSDSLQNRLANWEFILSAMRGYGVESVMIEGGATIINDLLVSGLVDSIITTVGPVFLGSEGVNVSPPSAIERLRDVRWWTGVQDAVVAGRLPEETT